jgi:hypothetical protein
MAGRIEGFFMGLLLSRRQTAKCGPLPLKFFNQNIINKTALGGPAEGRRRRRLPLHSERSSWWFDRTQEYLARRRGGDFGTYQYATRETLELASRSPPRLEDCLNPSSRDKRALGYVCPDEPESWKCGTVQSRI